MMMIKQFAEKNHGKVCRAYLKETETQHTATPPSMAETLDWLDRFCLILLQAVLPVNNAHVTHSSSLLLCGFNVNAVQDDYERDVSTTRRDLMLLILLHGPVHTTR